MNAHSDSDRARADRDRLRAGADPDRAQALAAARALHQHLHRLGQAAAPGRLVGAVLDEIGLAERYLSLAETPIGTVYVAFMGQGGQRICGVAPALDDA